MGLSCASRAPEAKTGSDGARSCWRLFVFVLILDVSHALTEMARTLGCAAARTYLLAR
ncbi:hypothetical protein CHLRE_12g496402v5 [Chlamydomonas reinhardtii]|uniref:Uncharacterized protein n=1 Tax=Chlamydomonas reinhardtii TaxID=3055 RepID=A0A2K3D3I3_CHLRE|nr:uncharacterized protein CHLRE_12g496402v5 [Chlamydomonas reinhardtii]PNW75102.1 hypothetical protein CHLRE_12g496402v5 [Chlamydomonas reinhardtii]